MDNVCTGQASYKTSMTKTALWDVHTTLVAHSTCTATSATASVDNTHRLDTFIETNLSVGATLVRPPALHRKEGCATSGLDGERLRKKKEKVHQNGTNDVGRPTADVAHL